MSCLAAEQLVFGVKTTGAANDLQKATGMARNMIALYGMSEELGLMAPATVQTQYLENSSYLDCFQQTSARIDEAVQTMLNNCYQKVLKLLQDNRSLLDKMSLFLLEKETITGKELMKFVNHKSENTEE